MIDGGCDVIEVGLPYSDPVMDGPTIQAAAERALVGRACASRDVFRVVEASAAEVPTLVMTYWNPVERYGVERFAGDLAVGRWRRADHAGPDPRTRPANGSLRPTRTASTRCSWSRRRRRAARLASTAGACRGFVYATAVMGVTGAREQTSDAGPDAGRPHARGHRPAGRRRARRLQRGARRPASRRIADAVIVGSAFVRAVDEASPTAGRGGRAVGALASGPGARSTPGTLRSRVGVGHVR